MKTYVYEGKNVEEIKKKALTELNVKEEDVIIKTFEEEGGLFKSKKSKIEVVVKDEIVEFLKELVVDITSKMGIKVNLECNKRDNYIKINLFSDNNAILIGKGGKTIEALQLILKNAVSIKTIKIIMFIIINNKQFYKQSKRLYKLMKY
jgi:spoIIIJ-associated protein